MPIREAAWLLGVGEATVCRAIRRGLLPIVRRGGRVGVPVAALARLLPPPDPDPDPDPDLRALPRPGWSGGSHGW